MMGLYSIFTFNQRRMLKKGWPCLCKNIKTICAEFLSISSVELALKLQSKFCCFTCISLQVWDLRPHIWRICGYISGGFSATYLEDLSNCKTLLGLESNLKYEIICELSLNFNFLNEAIPILWSKNRFISKIVSLWC